MGIYDVGTTYLAKGQNSLGGSIPLIEVTHRGGFGNFKRHM